MMMRLVPRAAGFLLACALASTSCRAAPQDAAPGGVLRATFLGSNPAQGLVDPATGKVTGVVADLVAEMARRMGVPSEIYPAANAADIVQRLNGGQSDVGFMAYDTKRAADVDFSHSYALMYNAFLARADAPIAATAEVDRPGVRVAAVRGQTQQIALSDSIRHASVIVLDKKPTPTEVEALLVSRRADVYGANRSDAEKIAADSGGTLKALPDNFLVVEQAIVIPHDQPQKMAEINGTLDAMLHDGFVERLLARYRNSGLAIATGTRP